MGNKVDDEHFITMKKLTEAEEEIENFKNQLIRQKKKEEDNNKFNSPNVK